MDSIVLQGPHKDFEAIKKLNENGVEFWLARELMPVLGYDQWKNFEEVVKKAQQACIKSGRISPQPFCRRRQNGQNRHKYGTGDKRLEIGQVRVLFDCPKWGSQKSTNSPGSNLFCNSNPKAGGF